MPPKKRVQIGPPQNFRSEGDDYARYVWPVTAGCEPVGPGCDGCRAAAIVNTLSVQGVTELVGVTERTNGAGVRWTGRVALRHDVLDFPEREHRGGKIGRTILVGHHGDPFHPAVPDDYLLEVFDVMRLCPKHTFLVLTRRPDRLLAFAARLCIDQRDGRLYLAEKGGLRWLPSAPHVRLGVGCSTQAEADARLPVLMRVPCAFRWAALEPLLEPVDVRRWLRPPVLERKKHLVLGDPTAASLKWVLVGASARYWPRVCLPWFESVIDQCDEAGVPVWVSRVGRAGWLDAERTVKFHTDSRTGSVAREWPIQLRVRNRAEEGE